MQETRIEKLIESLYSFVKENFDLMHQEFKAVRGEIRGVEDRLTARIDEVDERLGNKLDKLETNHENRISNLEDSMRVVKTKLGLN
jgi:hypothetical protein